MNKKFKEDDVSLDQQDQRQFREQAHKLLDACIDRLENARNLPWQPMDENARTRLEIELPHKPKETEEIMRALQNDVMPYATGNTHPRFFGWVHGTGMQSCLLADMVASTMNSNCGGRDHGAIYIERCVIEWCKQIFDFPKSASGLLTVGTSHATILALVTARTKILGENVIAKGIKNMPEIAVYCAQGTHACVKKALQVMGHGSNVLREIETQGLTGGVDAAKLQENIKSDQEQGIKPLCVVATAGAVNTGAFDDLDVIADICAEHGIWMHVDGAFGAWAKIADQPWSNLVNGIDRADSIAFDFHKWMSIQYDCGAVLIKDAENHYNSFASRPAYLAEQATGLGGGDLWFCDFGTDLSRGFRALKVWTALQHHGLQAFSKVITKNCKQATYMADLVERSKILELAAPVILNVCVFYVQTTKDDAQDDLNTSIVHNLQNSGEVVFSTTKIDDRSVIRAAIVNHRTTFEDIEYSINAVTRAIEIL